MKRPHFVGRSRELEVLDRLWDSDAASFLVLYGRRRVGKTRLLTHWLQNNPDAGLYWVAEPSSALTQLRSFSHALMQLIDPDAEIPPDFTFSTWELAFRQLALYAKDNRVAMMIDEVTYLIDVNPDFVGVLQKVWDRWLSDSKVMLTLSGSQMGLMKKHLLAYDAPLYGRATAQMTLPPLPFGASRDYFPNYSPAERVTTFAMWGGIPAYWERLDDSITISENLRQNILPSHAWMIDESRILLQDFINDLHNYVGILRAVADEQQGMGEIASRTGITSSKASFYLSVLRDTGFVTRRVPISQRNMDSRRGRYVVADPYLRFFYRFLSARQSQLALGQINPIIKLIEKNLDHFIAANTWPELCRDWVVLAGSHEAIPVITEDIGSEWTKSQLVDVVGINVTEHALVMGDCFWQEPVDIVMIDAFLQKATALLPKSDKSWSLYFTLFSSEPWAAGLLEQAEALIAQRAEKSKRWHSIGIRLLDLAQVDADLSVWSI